MNDMWTRVVRDQLKPPGVRTIVLFPAELSGASASFQFTSNASGRWTAQAPCAIDIAP